MKLFLTDKMLLFEDIIEDFAAESFFSSLKERFTWNVNPLSANITKRSNTPKFL